MPFPIEQQEQTEWCWAAVSATADHYFIPGSTLTQCEIASKEFSPTNCCLNPGACNQTMQLQKVLKPMGRLESVITSPLSFKEIKDEIRARRPIAVRIAWFDDKAHFVLICGFTESKSGNSRKLEIADPFYGDVDNGQYFGIWEIDFDLFPGAYQQGGSWTATYKLK